MVVVVVVVVLVVVVVVVVVPIVLLFDGRLSCRLGMREAENPVIYSVFARLSFLHWFRDHSTYGLSAITLHVLRDLFLDRKCTSRKPCYLQCFCACIVSTRFS